jgi:hypothetical protein
VKAQILRKFLSGYLVRLVLASALLINLVVLTAQPAQADSSAQLTHEDPAAAKVIFNGLTLLVYYSDCLEPVLNLNAEKAQKDLAVMPFANIPEALNQATATLARSSVALAANSAALIKLWDYQSEMVREYRFSEARAVYLQIKDAWPAASAEFEELRWAVEQTGSYLKIDNNGPPSDLKIVYAEVQSKLDRLQAMLELLIKPLATAKTANSPTLLSLEITPLKAFVGDKVHFSGELSNHEQPLAGREVELLLNNNRYLSIMTDDRGKLEGDLILPYWYQPDLIVQAVYYPRENDTGLYLGTSSPAIKLTLLFYRTALSLNPLSKVYPGRSTLIQGVLDYAGAPVVERQGARVWLDDSLVSRINAGPLFEFTLAIDPDSIPGNHTLTVYIPADGRYAAVSNHQALPVELAPISLDFKLPPVVLLPGRLWLEGRAYSDLGPVQGAELQAGMGGTLTALTTSETGEFSTGITLSNGFSLLGNQNLVIRVKPHEPWNDELEITRAFFVINWISCGVLMLVLVGMAVLLPRRWRAWQSLFRKTRATRPQPSPSASPEPGLTLPVAAQPESGPGDTGSLPADRDEASADAILKWYRAALDLMQKLTGSRLKPQQTLREYAHQNGPAMGRASRFFLEFTLLIERLLYSRRSAGPQDIAQARELEQAIRQKEDRRENL